MPEMTHHITVSGCDDQTDFDMALTFDEAKLIEDVARRCCEASTLTCQPTMHIKEIQK